MLFETFFFILLTYLFLFHIYFDFFSEKNVFFIVESFSGERQEEEKFNYIDTQEEKHSDVDDNDDDNENISETNENKCDVVEADVTKLEKEVEKLQMDYLSLESNYVQQYRQLLDKYNKLNASLNKSAEGEIMARSGSEAVVSEFDRLE